jgi:hypothetical protein
MDNLQEVARLASSLTVRLPLGAQKACSALSSRLHLLQEEAKESLRASIARLTARGRGILAADESNGTIGKRLIAAGEDDSQWTTRARAFG